MTTSHMTLWSGIPFPSPLQEQFALKCQICRDEVCLEDAKTDEYGMPVHEHCYVSRLTLEKAA